MSPCHICSQIQGDPGHDLIAGLLPHQAYLRRIVIEDDLFAVMPSLGALRPGHLLICPRQHVRRLAALPAAQMVRLHRMIAEVRDRLRLAGLTAGPTHDLLLFEHGMAATGDRIACTVDHAHLHAVPLPASIAEGVLAHLTWQTVGAGADALADAVGEHEYLLRWQFGGPLQVATAPPEGHPSQAMRRALAERLAPTVSWDWRAEPDAEQTHHTWARLVAQ
jgi:diadenosine tetraphosphate (Ap4A) HIT family hydrolase